MVMTSIGPVQKGQQVCRSSCSSAVWHGPHCGWLMLVIKGARTCRCWVSVSKQLEPWHKTGFDRPDSYAPQANPSFAETLMAALGQMPGGGYPRLPLSPSQSPGAAHACCWYPADACPAAAALHAASGYCNMH